MDVTERVATALACAALDPRLVGLLFLDLDPSLVLYLAQWLADLLGDDPPIIPIAPRMAEETLWERLRLAPGGPGSGRRAPEDLGFRWEPGPLAGYGRPPGIVMVPDLALLGLPAARAAITLVDAEVAHLERSSVTKMWHPRDWWLAALRRQDVDQVSPHLLDRFAVRIDAGGLERPPGGGPVLPGQPEWQRLVAAAREDPLPTLSPRAAERAATRIPSRAVGARRYIALARVARALAALAGQPEVFSAHVDEAAAVVGLPAVAGTGELVPFGADAEATLTRAANGGNGNGHVQGNGKAGAGPERPDGVNGHVTVITGGNPVSLLPGPPGDLAPPLQGAVRPRSDDPYPEDRAGPRRDPALLRVSWQRPLTGPPRGQPIGTQRTLDTDKSDIAVTATLLNAARFQKRRCDGHYTKGCRLHIFKRDLLSYRRAPLPGHLLVLLLDHTCQAQEWDWQEQLTPYLGWAYVTRALVGVVEVGAGDAANELRATQFQTRGVLDPRVAQALARPHGRATPLAHGLTLAAAMLRHATQLGGPLIVEVLLVVVTDGRANVPLAVSHGARLPPPLGPAGVSDSVSAAREVATLLRGRAASRHIHATVIDPGPRPNGYLVTQLAAALGASLVPGGRDVTLATAGPGRSAHVDGAA